MQGQFLWVLLSAVSLHAPFVCDDVADHLRRPTANLRLQPDPELSAVACQLATVARESVLQSVDEALMIHLEHVLAQQGLVEGLKIAQLWRHEPTGATTHLPQVLSWLKAHHRALETSHFGVASLPSVTVAIMVQRLVRMNSQHRTYAPGDTLRLEGQMVRGVYSPQVFVLTPANRIRRLPISLRDSRFAAKMALVWGVGEYVVEVLVHTRRGVQVACLFSVWVGSAPPLPVQKIFPKEPPSITPDEAERQLARLINRDRWRQGLAPLARHRRLRQLARSHSRNMATFQFFGHVCPRYGSLNRRLSHFGLQGHVVSENVAVGPSLGRIHHELMRSPSHRRNILAPSARLVGVGTAIAEPSGQRRFYVTQEFMGISY